MKSLRPFLSQLLPFFLLALFFFILVIGVRRQSHSWYFQDETEHVTVGWMVIDFQRQLYDNLSTNHQPLPIFVGGVLAKLIPYATFFEFIDRLRLSMWLFAGVTSLAIVTRFKWRGLGAVLLTYSLGHYFMAWHVLSEPLVVPAVVWMILTIVDKKTFWFDHWLFGFAAFWIVFSLLPLWPFVLLCSAYYWWHSAWRDRVGMVVGMLLPSAALFLFINPVDWWRETIVNNVLYFIPYEAQHDNWHYLRLLTYPFLHILYLHSPVARFYVGAATFLGAAFFALQPRAHWSRKKLFKIGFFLLLLLSLNPRISDLNVTFYWGFHLFPYIAGLAAMVSVLTTEWFNHYRSNKKLRKVTWAAVVVLGALVLNNLWWVGEKRDKLSDYYIQYDTFQAYGTALKTISHSGDTLMTGPDGAGYMNMMAGLPLAGRQNFHLDWAYRVPDLRTAWTDLISTQPPTFVYFDLGNDVYSQALQPVLESNYITLHRADGSPTLLKMNKSAVEKVSDDQWQKFEAQTFLRPTKK